LILSKGLFEITGSGVARGVAKEAISYSVDESNLCIFDHEDALSLGLIINILLVH
jgi:hypothetical protein